MTLTNDTNDTNDDLNDDTNDDSSEYDSEYYEPTICLNLICRNEAHLIIDCLDSVQDHVTDYVICDLGSTDGTKERIEEWYRNHPKPGHLFNLEFKNFGATRTEALRLAQEHSQSDYILFMDANMRLKIRQDPIDNTDLPFILSVYESISEFNIVMVKICQHTLQYYRRIIIRRDMEDVKYIGATHEYLSAAEDEQTLQIDKIYLEISQSSDFTTGGSKMTQDIHLLLEELIEEPDNSRDMFYLAQSYRDTGNDLMAIKWYRKRADLENTWPEERYISLIEIYKCHVRLRSDYQIRVQPLFQAIRLDHQRLEAYSHLMSTTLRDQFLSPNFFHVSRLIFSQFGISSQIECDSSKYLLFVDQRIYDHDFLFNYANFLQEGGYFSTAIEVIDQLLQNESSELLRLRPYLLKIKRMSQAKNRFIDLITEAIIETLCGRPEKLFSDPVKNIIKIK